MHVDVNVMCVYMVSVIESFNNIHVPYAVYLVMQKVQELERRCDQSNSVGHNMRFSLKGQKVTGTHKGQINLLNTLK